ncbi:hypothetical protein [Oceanobacillus senegalensis]|uniref:hypothetical protein n=1 Tax=Oceanobacillus senegalensis TaxID=1936063 RepID=UPI000A3130AD|nr:hypothetical protein [Oceanobacillus senegalensis]
METIHHTYTEMFHKIACNGLNEFSKKAPVATLRPSTLTNEQAMTEMKTQINRDGLTLLLHKMEAREPSLLYNN